MEFAYNNTLSATTSVSPFFANKRYHLNITVYSEHDIVSSQAYDFAVNLNELQSILYLPEFIHSVHPVFHMSMLEPTMSNSFSKRIQLAPAPVIIDGKPKYEISQIVDSKIDY